jgi:predicted NBD/HSP70 family sugar kinase
MEPIFKLIKPTITPPLDEGFRPAVLANRAYQEMIHGSESVPLVLGLEREDGFLSRLETRVFPENHPQAAANLLYIERLVKFLLWQRGGWKVYVGGPLEIGAYIQNCYKPGGSRAFDCQFMEEVYEKPFSVVCCQPGDVPLAKEGGQPLGRHLDGCRIGFDLGASDRKVSAVNNGQVVYSEEVIWEPRKHRDPEYHYNEVMTALKSAAQKLPHVDAIGGSSAGIYINNRPMVASIFRGVPKESYDQVKNLFLRIRHELEVPLEVVNDGDVAALAGAMSLEDNGVLGIALGSSEAAGYVSITGNITGWLNELAFAPIDYNPAGPSDEWSGDIGVGSQYFSQQCVFRLAPKAGIEIKGATDADRLKYVQEKLETGHAGAVQIWQSMGVYMGYGIAHYASFYDLKHILLLGRCTSGKGGQIILDVANAVLQKEFPEIASRVSVQLPD